jgi:glycyl-tRNA synthetase beta chain
MRQPLLIEIGVEELPAIPFLKELKNIDKKWLSILEKYNLASNFEIFYTPRRLTILHDEFNTSQPDQTKEIFGAPKKIAFKDGEPTKAAIGFAKKCGIELNEIEFIDKNGTEVLYYKQSIEGEKSSLLLNSIINEFVSSLEFGKSMRWGSRKDSFIRPIRWLLVMLGNSRVEAELFGVKSSNITYPHRISSFDPIEVSSIKSYFELLKSGGVTLFQDERRESILNSFDKIEKELNISIDKDNELLDEVVAITENPTTLIGEFDREFLKLPKEVIITSMKEHQRYFPIYSNDGKLLNKFIFISNALTSNFQKIIKGNEKVLKPRLSDAMFFWNNDLDSGFRVEELKKVTFINGLGSMYDKQNREKNIALNLSTHFNLKDSELQDLNRACDISKADLMSEMVYEFTELQGIMGYYYAKEFNESSNVSLALKEQYLPDSDSSELPSNSVSSIVALSYKIDNILALFSINRIPTGSKDPFALRRATIGIFKILLNQNIEIDLIKILKELSKNYKKFDFDKLIEFIDERIYNFFDVNKSIIKSVLATDDYNIITLKAKIDAVNKIVNSSDFKDISSTFKRVANIIDGIWLDEITIDDSLFSSEYERELYQAFNIIKNQDYKNFDEQLEALFNLKPYLDRFFDNVMVNDKDESIKNNRKSLIASIYVEFRKVADIKEITI